MRSRSKHVLQFLAAYPQVIFDLAMDTSSTWSIYRAFSHSKIVKTYWNEHGDFHCVFFQIHQWVEKTWQSQKLAARWCSGCSENYEPSAHWAPQGMKRGDSESKQFTWMIIMNPLTELPWNGVSTPFNVPVLEKVMTQSEYWWFRRKPPYE